MVGCSSLEMDIVTTAIDRANAEFWHELCGSTFAKSLGITDHSLDSLGRFDRAYLEFYPYLLKRVGLEDMAGKRVLEVGLGYGTLSQKLAEVAADYTGLRGGGTGRHGQLSHAHTGVIGSSHSGQYPECSADVRKL